MADRSGPRAPRGWLGPPFRPRRRSHSDRRRSRPAVESLEGRTLLAGGHSPTSPVPIHPEPIGKPTPQQLGAAYRQILDLQTSTLVELSAAHRRLYHAYDQLAARAHPAVAGDRRILQQGLDLRAGAEQGLVVARGIEDLNAYTDKIYIPQGLYTTLGDLVQQAQTTAANLVRSAQRGTGAAIRKLDALAAGLPQDGR